MEKKKRKPKNILVPTDFSVTCENAFEHAVKLANNPDSKIFLLHVMEEKTFKFPRDVRDEYESENENKKALALLNSLIAKKGKKNVFPLVKNGDLFTKINDVAEDVDADLILLGTHGKNGFQKVFGSYALKVIDNTQLPVMVVHEKPQELWSKNIIFPITLHEEDRQKAKIAVEYAIDYNAKIHLIAENPEDKTDKIRMEAIAQQISSYFTRNNVEFTLRVSKFNNDEFEKDIEIYATQVKADFILVLSNPDHHYLFGGGKEESYIFNKSHIPILCISSRKFTTIGSDSAFSGAYY